MLIVAPLLARSTVLMSAPFGADPQDVLHNNPLCSGPLTSLQYQPQELAMVYWLAALPARFSPPPKRRSEATASDRWSVRWRLDGVETLNG